MNSMDGLNHFRNELSGLPLGPRKQSIIYLSASLALLPHGMTAEKLSPLRALGFSDDEIHAMVLVVSCFSFMNRLADGTGVGLQPDRYGLATELFGADALERHLEWAEATTNAVEGP